MVSAAIRQTFPHHRYDSCHRITDCPGSSAKSRLAKSQFMRSTSMIPLHGWWIQLMVTGGLHLY